MFLYVHKGRHVVVSNTDVSQLDGGEVSVARVGFAPEVSGVARRGRPPTYSKPVPVAELAPVSVDEVGEDMVKLAETLMAETTEGEV